MAYLMENRGEVPAYPDAPRLVDVTQGVALFVGRRSDHTSRDHNPSTIFEMELDAEVQEIAIQARKNEQELKQFLEAHKKASKVRLFAFVGINAMVLVAVGALALNLGGGGASQVAKGDYPFYMQDTKAQGALLANKDMPIRQSDEDMATVTVGEILAEQDAAVRTQQSASGTASSLAKAPVPLASVTVTASKVQPVVAAVANKAVEPPKAVVVALAKPAPVVLAPKAVEPSKAVAAKPPNPLAVGPIPKNMEPPKPVAETKLKPPVIMAAQKPAAPPKAIAALVPPDTPTQAVSDKAKDSGKDEKIFVIEDNSKVESAAAKKAESGPPASASKVAAVATEKKMVVDPVAKSPSSAGMPAPTVGKTTPATKNAAPSDSEGDGDVAVSAKDASGARQEKYGSTGVITLTPGGAIVYDRAKKTQRMVAVGGKMPDGSVLKSIDVSGSRIKTDKGDVVYE